MTPQLCENVTENLNENLVIFGDASGSKLSVIVYK